MAIRVFCEEQISIYDIFENIKLKNNIGYKIKGNTITIKDYGIVCHYRKGEWLIRQTGAVFYEINKFLEIVNKIKLELDILGDD